MKYQGQYLPSYWYLAVQDNICKNERGCRTKKFSVSYKRMEQFPERVKNQKKKYHARSKFNEQRCYDTPIAIYKLLFISVANGTASFDGPKISDFPNRDHKENIDSALKVSAETKNRLRISEPAEVLMNPRDVRPHMHTREPKTRSG